MMSGQQATPDGKEVVNAIYHGAVITGLAIGFARLGKAALGGMYPKLDFTPRDAGMIIVDVTAALAARDLLIKQGIIPADILK
jgi:hypothetical protein